jgi:phosphatidylserine/phosphatidylglycerophosphate/cardiolipin synthase-like enzyme
MHNKFWIFDRQIVWTGSTNITKSGIYTQNNNVLVIRSPELANIYEREFDEMWNGQFGARSPSTNWQTSRCSH